MKVNDLWAKTFKLRKIDAVNKEYEDVKVIYESWPILKESCAIKLVSYFGFCNFCFFKYLF